MKARGRPPIKVSLRTLKALNRSGMGVKRIASHLRDQGIEISYVTVWRRLHGHRN